MSYHEIGDLDDFKMFLLRKAIVADISKAPLQEAEARVSSFLRKIGTSEDIIRQVSYLILEDPSIPDYMRE